MNRLHPDIARVLIEPAAIRAEVVRVAGEIARDHPGEPPILVGVLKSAVVFLADLVRALPIPALLDFVSVAEYETPTPSGVARIRKDLDQNIEGRDVVVVEGVIDTGLRLSYLLRNFGSRQPRSLRVCAFLVKQRPGAVPLTVDYRAFELPAEFVVGYGLGYRERYRQLPYVGVLAPSALAR